MTNFVMKMLVIMNETINIRRKELGLKIYDLAQKVGVDSSLMSRILAGKRTPTDMQLKKIAKTLSLSFHELLKEKVGGEVAHILYQYPEIAKEAMLVAEQRVEHLLSDKRYTTIPLSDSIRTSLDELDEKRKRWMNKKPLNTTQLLKMQEYFYTEYTYESNRIEGNTLDLQETHLVINEGITIGGKSMQEHLEAVNHKEAIEWIVDLAKKNEPFTEHALKQIHYLILQKINKEAAGVYRSSYVRITGSKHTPPDPYLIDKMMEEYFIFYNDNKDKLHPVILAAEMHERLVTIHPFVDGNGRTSRLVMNLLLLQHGYTLLNLKGSRADRQRYFKSLEAVQVNHERDDFYALILERAHASMDEHLLLAGC